MEALGQGHTAKHSVENWDGLLDNMACALRPGSSDLHMRTTNENERFLANLGATERISVYTK